MLVYHSCFFGLGHSLFTKLVLIELIVIEFLVVFSHLGFWSGNLFLIAPFPDICVLIHMLK